MPTRKVLREIAKNQGEKTPEVKFLLYDDGLTARGKEKKVGQVKSSAPKSKSSPKTLSYPAKLMQSWLAGSEDAYTKLSTFIVSETVKHSVFEQWKLPMGKVVELVNIAANRYSKDDDLSLKEKAGLLKESQSRYTNYYAPLVDNIDDTWFSRYKKEIDNLIKK